MKKKRNFLLIIISLIVILLVGYFFLKPQTKDDSNLAITTSPLTRSESLLHTVVQIKIYHKGQEKVMEEAIDYIKEMEKLLSTNLEGSDVYRINHAAGEEAVKVDKRTFTIIKEALKMSEKSDGKFDISIGAVTNLWRIGDDEARLPSDEGIKAALPFINYKNIKIDEEQETVYIEKGMTLELGAISKGYIADGVKSIFEKHHISTAIINLGGNVLVMGTSPNNEKGWNVGVQNPDEVRGDTVGAVHVKNRSVVTSGIYERYLEVDGKTYHHIMNPETGYPVENNISGVTVFTDKSIQGDELSTSLYLLGIEEGMKYIESLDNVEAVFIDKDKGLHISSGLKEKFELKNEDYHIVENE
ncbi:thiamine biosynthesis lipoprotein [Streptococcus henryi]|uniref:FAD:protein FMN transferase n=1 Tax=Streptococcus henryi TaxID=439219 RepID=A0A1G6A9Z1_9STRE|nr:FAD:protein FMN transferase [Streptococcus henryi]SDB05136.1 thiamine biosynthesis lipoprotein [Streptococcus henryi]